MSNKCLLLGASHYVGVPEAGRQGKTSSQGVHFLIFLVSVPEVEPVPEDEPVPEVRSTLADICSANMRRRKSEL